MGAYHLLMLIFILAWVILCNALLWNIVYVHATHHARPTRRALLR